MAARGIFVCGALLSSLLLASGVSSAAEPKKSAAPATTSVRAAGNPRFYDELGKRYHVLASRNGYRERGVASWYGRPFHGRPTSSGERYDMNEMTAAHTTLPLPTWVEVTNLNNGKRVIVKVNDRGPFVEKRLIDLSHAAANALDIVRTGTARVEVRALDGPPKVTNAVTNADVVTEDGRRKSTHRVRIGPLLDTSEVDRVSGQLRELGAKRSQRVVMR
jgi:rare lipoprotein A (peptidoglycan hydrolase)